MMKILVAIVAGTVVAGLLTYAILEISGTLGLLPTSGRVTLPIWLFVVQIALVGILAGSLSQIFLRLLRVEEERNYRGLAQRLEDLESNERG